MRSLVHVKIFGERGRGKKLVGSELWAWALLKASYWLVGLILLEISLEFH